MKLTFEYNFEKDVYNFIKTSKSLHNSSLTKFQQAYVNETGEKLDDELSVRNFIQDYSFKYKKEIEAKILEIQNSWDKIKETFLRRCNDMFEITYPDDTLKVYLTTNQRCSYSIDNNLFFVYVFSKSSNRIIMHEILHFYTKKVFYKKALDFGLIEMQYEDFKEALTEILNCEFSDLLNGAVDDGYPQHKHLRVFIKEFWSQNKNLHDLSLALFDKLKNS